MRYVDMHKKILSAVKVSQYRIPHILSQLPTSADGFLKLTESTSPSATVFYLFFMLSSQIVVKFCFYHLCQKSHAVCLCMSVHVCVCVCLCECELGLTCVRVRLHINCVCMALCALDVITCTVLYTSPTNLTALLDSLNKISHRLFLAHRMSVQRIYMGWRRS